jgi:hypothetical protein
MGCLAVGMAGCHAKDSDFHDFYGLGGLSDMGILGPVVRLISPILGPLQPEHVATNSK